MRIREEISRPTKPLSERDISTPSRTASAATHTLLKLSRYRSIASFARYYRTCYALKREKHWVAGADDWWG